jgi:hypothetical protein
MKIFHNYRSAIPVMGNVLSIAVLWFVFRLLPLPPMDCLHPPSQSIIFAFSVTLILDLPMFVLARTPAAQIRIMVAILLASVVLAWWLGSYQYSPLLGFANGRNSVLSGFRIIRQGRPVATVSSGEVLSLASGSVTAIEALVLPESARCNWQSTNGADMDGSDGCNLIYSPPKSAEFDILKVLVVPGCGLPNKTGLIKISRLP